MYPISSKPLIQTGSGKTHTMGTGFETDMINPELVGIVPRAVEQIFDTIESLKAKAKEAGDIEPTFTIEVQFIEVSHGVSMFNLANYQLYNEDLIDLLAIDRTAIVKIHENPDNGQIMIKNAANVPVHSAADVLETLRAGAINRTTGSTNMNAKSSRSHAIFSLHVKQEKYEVIFLKKLFFN